MSPDAERNPGRPPLRLAVASFLIPLLAVAYGLVYRTKPFTPWEEVWLPFGCAGALAALVYWHCFRGLGFIPISILIVLGVAAWATFIDQWNESTVWVASALLGFSISRLVIYALRFRLGRNWVGISLSIYMIVAGAILGTGVDTLWNPPRLTEPRFPPTIFLGWLVGLLLITWSFLFRPMFELACEPPLWVMYRIRGAGAGVAAMPARGPCLVVANHACWFDPFFLAKVLPRPITAMMTSRFYDKPVLHWLFKYVLRAIRVPERAFHRQEMPDEVREAIAALDRGECVVIFPEGYLRRSEEKPLRRFGRGVWQILAARPQTPVFACWIEGNWGSFCSYFNGKPTKNKRLDIRRPIGVAVAAPIVLDAAMLANHLPTRIFLMNRVGEARKSLGLDELPPYELPEAEKEEDEGPA